MKNNLQTSLNFTFAAEGLYCCIRSDPGNWTGGRVGKGALIGSKFGISAPMLCETLGRDAKLFEMRSLTKEQAENIATYKFWNVMFCYELPSGIDLLVFDHGFNTGTHESVKLLQKLVGVTRDGIIGPKTISALNHFKIEDIKKFLPTSCIEQIQKSLNIPTTWNFDTETIQAIKKHKVELCVMCCALANEQDKIYRSKRDFQIFGNGWLSRVKKRLEASLKILREERKAQS